MSLVQAIITDNFIIVGADTRATAQNGFRLDTVNKLIKLNKHIIFGCTGDVYDNYILFADFCNYSVLNGLTNSENNIDVSYNDFIKIITHRFNVLNEKNINRTQGDPYDVTSIVCGYNGKEFEVTMFKLGDSDSVPAGIYTAHKANNFPFKCVTAGLPLHSEKLQILLEISYKVNHEQLTTLQCRNALINNFNIGSRRDETINNKVHIEKIRLKDVIS